MELRPGDRIGDYHIVGWLGQGAMGAVYQASHPRFGDAALKVVLPDAAPDASLRTKFVREGELISRLHHRNIVTVFECGVHDEVPFIAMELLVGATLKARCASGTRPAMPLALDIVIQLCDGLQYAHDHNVVHRDVKPANVWLLENGGVKLLDFGVARLQGSELTRVDGVLGAVAYMAPEQLSRNRVDARADIYSAGVILYELLSGHRPFESETVLSLLGKIRHQEVVPLGDRVAGVPTSLETAVMRALARNPADRYAHAGDLASDLRLIRYSPAVSQPERDDRAAPVEPQPAFAPARPDGTIVRPRREAGASIVSPPGGNALSSAQPVADAGTQRVTESRGADASAARAVPAPPAAAAAGAGEQPPPRRATAPEERPPTVHPRPVNPVPDLPPASRARTAWVAAAAAGLVLLVAGTIWTFRADSASAVPTWEARIESVPAGAAIRIDDADTGLLTPALVSWPRPPRRIEVARAGYQPGAAENPPSEPGDEGPLRLTFALARLLRVETQPPGAVILVGGRSTGLVTPAEVPLGHPLPTVVEVRLDAYAPQVTEVTEAILDSGRIAVTMSPHRAARTGDAPVPPDTRGGRPPAFTADEGPEDDGRAAGPRGAESGSPRAEPVAVQVVGSYAFTVSGCGVSLSERTEHRLQVQAPCTLRLRAPSYHLNQELPIAAVAGTVDFAVPQLASLELRSAHESCNIIFNGRAVGTPPVRLQVASGNYPVLVKCKDRAYSIRSFAVAPGASKWRLDDFFD